MAAIGVKGAIAKITPSLTLFLFMFCLSLMQPVLRTLILRKTCSNHYTQEICSDLYRNRKIGEKLRMYADNVSSKVDFIGVVVSAFMTLLLGSLADKHGRKKILIVPCIGTAICAVLMFIQAEISLVSIVLTFGSHLIRGFAGGKSAFISTMMCFTTDKASPEKRAMSLSTLIAFMALGTTLEETSRGLVVRVFSIGQIYLLVLLCQIVIILLIHFFLQEDHIHGIENRKAAEELPQRRSVKGIFKSLWENFTAGPRLLLARKEGKRRTCLLLVIMVSILGMVCSTADNSFIGRQLRKPPVNWPEPKVVYFNKVKNVLSLVGTVLLTQLYFRFASSGPTTAEFNLIFLAESCNLLSVLAFAVPSLMVKIVPLLALFAGPLQPVTRSYLSGLVGPSETGALFGFINFLNTFAVPAGAAMVNNVLSLSYIFAPMVAFSVILMTKSFIISIIWVLRRRAVGEVKKGV